MERGMFISVEGGEGVGKSVFIKNLSHNLSLNYPQKTICVTREPGGTEQAEQIRKLFLNETDNEPWLAISEFCLMSAARSQHVSYKIRPLLEKGQIVLCDRFADSSRVYQGMLGGIKSELIEMLTLNCCNGLEPDLTFILDCDIAVSSQRIEERAKNHKISRFDKKTHEFHANVREAFLRVAASYPSRCKILDASQPPAMIVEDALKMITEHNNGRYAL